MQSMRSRVLWLVAGVFVSSLVMTPAVIIARPAVPTQPAVIATVNLEVVFNSLVEKATADKNLQAFADQLEKKQKASRAALDRLEEELGGLAPGSKAHQDKQRAWHEQSFQYQAEIEHNRLKLDKQKAVTMRNIYAHIKGEAKAMSQELGIDIIMLDDAIVDVELGTEAEVSKQISARRTLYCNPALDVTQDLIDRMNRKFKP